MLHYAPAVLTLACEQPAVCVTCHFTAATTHCSCCFLAGGATQGIEVGTALLTNVDLGAAVCKFTSAELLPVFEQTLKILLKQNQQTLANLPAFTATLTKVQPAALQVGCSPNNTSMHRPPTALALATASMVYCQY